MTIEEMQAEIERLKKELSEAKAQQKKAKRTKFQLPEEIRKKHKKLLKPEGVNCRFWGDDVVDHTRYFNVDMHIGNLSRFVRNAMFFHVNDFVMWKGDPAERVEHRLERYAKPYDEMTDEEYENYKNCMDEILTVIEKYAK